jgi:hypothetical protein
MVDMSVNACAISRWDSSRAASLCVKMLSADGPPVPHEREGVHGRESGAHDRLARDRPTQLDHAGAEGDDRRCRAVALDTRSLVLPDLKGLELADPVRRGDEQLERVVGRLHDEPHGVHAERGRAVTQQTRQQVGDVVAVDHGGGGFREHLARGFGGHGSSFVVGP